MSLLPRRATPDPTHTIKPTAHNLTRHETPRPNALDPATPKSLPGPPHDLAAPIPEPRPFELAGGGTTTHMPPGE